LSKPARRRPFTAFAPPNDAFAKLLAGTVDSLMKPENKDTLTNILTFHVVGKAVMAKAMQGMIKHDRGKHPVPILAGCTLQANWAEGKMMLPKMQTASAGRKGHSRPFAPQGMSPHQNHPAERDFCVR
jgi:uncharacterized surface protein with fasciclin (FAS1) repeats